MRSAWFIGVLVLGCQGEPLAPTDVAIVEDTDPDTLASFEVTGQVTDKAGTAIEGAFVQVGGRPETQVLSDAEGRFALWFTEPELGEPAIVASKFGYRAKGFEFFKPNTPITLELSPLEGDDNIEYEFQDPGDGFNDLEENCSHCHTSFVQQMLGSKHAEAASNPLLHDLYAGVASGASDAATCADFGGTWAVGIEPGQPGVAREKCYLGDGVLPALNANCGGPGQPTCDAPDASSANHPTAFGACADCHAPGIDGVAGGRNLHEAAGVSYDIGVHCDVCHKVKDVDLSQPPGVGQRLQLGRPNEPGKNMFIWEPVYYGPLPDVGNVAMGAVPQDKFNQSMFCAGCHEQNQPALIPGQALDSKWTDGLPVHSTYSEWENGPYNRDGTQCQFCHMPANTENINSIDIATPETESITFGFQREPEDNRKHTFRGPLMGSPRLIDRSTYVSIIATRDGDNLEASVSVANIGCGHALPTGEPMRSLMLLVEADGDCGPLEANGGVTISDVGGVLAQTSAMEVTGSDLEWAEGAALASPGDVIRVVRPTGNYLDYPGIGYFAAPERTLAEKGMPIDAPVATAVVSEVSGTTIRLDQPVSITSDMRVYLGEAPILSADGAPSASLAGHSGVAFARVLVNAEGERHVAHYEGVDMASDNRIPPGDRSITTHRFSVPAECSTGEVRATLVYRPKSLQLAAPRGWEAKDFVVSEGRADW